MNYKILFTDLDDTVFDSTSLYKQAIEMSWEHLRKFYNISLEDFQRVFLEIRTSLKTEYVHKTISHHRVVLFEKLLEYFKIPFNAGLLLEMDRTYWFCVNTYIQPFPTVIDTLNKIKEANVKILGLSDGTILDRLGNIDSLKMSKYFDHLVSSEEVINTKPELDMFNLALKKANCLKEDVLFVGDSWDADVVGGKSFGVQTVWFNPSNEIAPDNSIIKPDHTISEFSEILKILNI